MFTIISGKKKKDILAKLIALQIMQPHYDEDPNACFVQSTRLIPDLIYEIGGMKALTEAHSYIFDDERKKLIEKEEQM